MGNHVSFDRRPVDFAQLGGLSESGPLPSKYQSNIKVWKFQHAEQDTDEIVPQPLTNLNAAFDPSASYLLLHTYVKPGPDHVPKVPSARDRHYALLALACAAVSQSSPRGVRHPFSQSGVRPAAAADGRVAFAIYLWNGRSATRLVEAQALVRALELERLLLASRSFPRAVFSSGDNVPIYDTVVSTSTNGFRSLSPSVHCHLLHTLGAPVGPPVTFASLLGLSRPEPPRQSTAGSEFEDDAARAGSPSSDSSDDSDASSSSTSSFVEVTKPAPPPEPKPKPFVPKLALKPTGGAAAPAVPVVPPLQLKLAVPAVTVPDLKSPPSSGRASQPSSARAKPKAVSRETPQKPAVSPRVSPRSGGGGGHSPMTLKPGLPLRLPSRDTSGPGLISDPSREKIRKLQTYGPIGSEISGHLYVGSDQPADDEKWLLKTGITDIINVAASVCQNKFLNTFNYWDFPLFDAPDEEINAIFPEVLHIIDTVHGAGGKTYVHCSQGVSRSCTVVIAYLMWQQQLTYDQAFERVKALRPLCSPNSGFIARLYNWHTHLTTPRQVVLWRLAPFSAQYPVPFVLFDEGRVVLKDDGPGKPKGGNFKPAPTAMDPRTCYFLVSPTRLFSWRGSECPDSWLEEMGLLIPKVLKYCYGDRCGGRAPDAPPLAVEPLLQGGETAEFWTLCRMICSPLVVVKRMEEYDAVYTPEHAQRHSMALGEYRKMVARRQLGTRPTTEEALPPEKRKRISRTSSSEAPRKSPRDLKSPRV